jgi:hypothetical protein
MNETSKVQLTLYLGLGALLCTFCCFISWLYLPLFIGTLVVGYMAIQEAKETGEDTTLAKVGMGIATIPLVLGIVLGALYCVLGIMMGIGQNM